MIAVEMFSGCWCIVDERGRSTFEIESLDVLANVWAACILGGSLEGGQVRLGIIREGERGFEIYGD